jgi:NADPH-dependent ferric siderophore reductase
MNPLTRTLSDLAANRLFRAAEVTAVDDVATDFRVVHLGGDALRGVTWVPGQKVQLRIEGFTNRTYTPMRWDGDAGSTSLLAYVHGEGPGSARLAELAPGDPCQFFGPRASLDLTTVDGSPLLVGDETSLGLAAAWAAAVGRPAHHAIEAQDPHAVRSVVDGLGLASVDVLHAIDAPGVDGRAIEEHVAELVAGEPTVHLVLTGRAQTIRRVRATLKERGTHRGKVMVKAYWDENRSGLD